MSVTAITTDNFENEVLRSDKPVLVDFWATWCGPCRIVSPVIEEIAEEQQEIKVVKVDVDENEETAVTYGIMSIPTLMLFKNGKPVAQAVGVQSKNSILKMIGQ